MYSLKHRLDRRSLEMIYISFIRPVLEYGSVVWVGCSDGLRDSLEHVQLQAARIVTGAIRGTSHAKLNAEVGWPSLESRRSSRQLTILYNIINNNTPEYLRSHLPPTVNTISGYSLRNRNNLSVSRCNSISLQKSFFYSTMYKWNNLNDNVRHATSAKTFKKLVSNNNKVNKWYYFGDRFYNIILAKMRMKCSSLSAHLHRMHVIDDAILSANVATKVKTACTIS